MIPESPGLAHGGNPFLQQLDSHLSTDNLVERLSYSPLAGIDVRQIGIEARHQLLDRMQEEWFEPTSTALDLATRQYRLIRRGYLARDPRIPAVRKQTMRIARLSRVEPDRIPWFKTYAKGIRIEGETGTGKSYEIVRILNLLPRTITHLENRDAGWTHCVQAVWLYVPMSHDGSIGGLLLSILCALDETIGSEYSTTKSITSLSNEKLAVRIGIILRNHGVGVLVIDEIQARNFSGKNHGLAATFFLRLLNFGIPIVLVGNPFGLAAFDTFSQDTRRIGSGGSFDFRPHTPTDFDWVHCIAPAVWRYYVMPEPTPIQDKDGLILFRYSGGIRDYACRVSGAAQRIALDVGAPALLMEHLDQALLGPDFSPKERDLIFGFRDRNPLLLCDFEDVRWKMYADQWSTDVAMNSVSPAQDDAGSTMGTNQSLENQPNAPSKALKPAHMRDLENAKRQRTRRTNEAQRHADTRSQIGLDDMRGSGLHDLLIADFEDLRSRSESNAK